MQSIDHGWRISPWDGLSDGSLDSREKIDSKLRENRNDILISLPSPPLFQLVGLTTVGVAVWMLTDPSFMISMTQDESNYYIGLYIFLAIGALMLIVAFLGCCGAFKESQCLLVSVSDCGSSPYASDGRVF